MPRLGTNSRPATVRVQTMERAHELVTICESRGWKVVVGIEEDQPEDISDVERLLSQGPAVRPLLKTSPARNAPCPCGSGRKYKGCCGRNRR